MVDHSPLVVVADNGDENVGVEEKCSGDLSKQKFVVACSNLDKEIQVNIEEPRRNDEEASRNEAVSSPPSKEPKIEYDVAPDSSCSLKHIAFWL